MKACSQGTILKREVAARIIQSKALSGDGEGLAGCAADKKVNCSISVFLNRSECRRLSGISCPVTRGCGPNRLSCARLADIGWNGMPDSDHSGLRHSQSSVIKRYRAPCCKNGVSAFAGRILRQEAGRCTVSPNAVSRERRAARH